MCALVVSLCVAGGLAVLSSCAPGSGGRAAAGGGSIEPAPDRPARVVIEPTATAAADLPGVHNVVAYADGVYSGSQPEGPHAFETLAGMGVKTVISVDGAAPDVGAAAARGLTYVHLPIGYDGVSAERREQLARATRDALRRGPVYIHCHHGKHRSAGAAGSAVVSLGLCTPEHAMERMRVSKTAANYTGLWAAPGEARRLSDAEIDRIAGDFPAVSRPSGMVAAMVEMDHAYDHLKQIQKAGWTAPSDHPDLVPAAEAGRLAEAVRLLREHDDVKGKPKGFMELLAESFVAADALEKGLAAGAKDTARLDADLKRLGASCGECHMHYRD